MASLLTHAVASVSLGQAAAIEWRKQARFWVVSVVCSLLPDLDVIGFRFGVRYGDLWGHRGMTHSILMAVIIATLVTVIFFRGTTRKWKLCSLLFVVTASHGVLDAMTNGGLGVAFFSPFNTHRYFLAWRPIRVSPIGISGFFSSRGVRVLRSEALWVWVPALFLAVILRGVNRLNTLRNANRE